jgi:hypothetical protein
MWLSRQERVDELARLRAEKAKLQLTASPTWPWAAYAVTASVALAFATGGHEVIDNSATVQVVGWAVIGAVMAAGVAVVWTSVRAWAATKRIGEVERLIVQLENSIAAVPARRGSCGEL